MLKLIAFPLLLIVTLAAQTSDPLSFEVKRSYSEVRAFLLRMSEMMPAEQYSFRPTQEVETFARRVAHIADANYRTCTALQGPPKSLGAASKTDKAELLGLLKQSFLQEQKIIRMGVPPVRLEILTSISGVDFASCFNRRVHAELDGVSVNLIHLNDLKRNKAATGRLRDRLDLEQLP